MFERFRRSSPEDLPNQQEAHQMTPEPAIGRQTIRLAMLAKDFDGTVRKYLGDERADEYARQQREVASKVHRTPPESLDGMRF